VSFVQFLPVVVRTLVRTLLYGWFLALLKLLRGAWAVLVLWLRRIEASEQDPRGTQHDDCINIDNPAFHRPDPCIYSQQYLMALGLAVTWDNPDIAILLNGVPVPEHELLPDTEYEIDATVWNNSYEAPVVGLPVHFSYLSFGVATENHLIGTAVVDLGVKGGPNYPAHALIPWKTPPAPGHYCVQVLLDPPDDLEPRNNLGQNNLDVVAAHSPATFSFSVRNDTPRPERYSFEVDTYTLPATTACPTKLPRRRPSQTERIAAAQALHDPAAHPVPPGWTVELTPSPFTLDPGQEVDVSAVITPAAGFTGQQAFNVRAVHGAGPAGGVSLIVTKA
jgi:hypothetical protein